MQARHVIGRWYPMPPMWLEGRAWLEYAQLMRDPILGGAAMPDGKGKPVMLIPGLLAGDRSLDVMRGWLRRNGYRPLRSGIDINIAASTTLVERIAGRLRAEVPAGQKAVLIGQSRGGNLGFGLAQRYPELVEKVIALGSPLADPLDVHPSVMVSVQAFRLWHTLRRGPVNVDAGFDQSIREPAKVPTISMYTKTDGIVYWQACLRPDVEAIEVGGSHTGMSVNPRVYRAIAEVLKG
jgi:pimeloyl-ACP methyl ester carboxylesterase